MPEHGFPLTSIFLYKDRVVDSVLERENTGQRKPASVHILSNGSIFNSFSSLFIPLFVTVLFILS